DKDSYEIVENEDEESPHESVSSITKVLERNDAGEAAVIEHFKHIHYLILGDKVGEYDDKCCDVCLLPIVASFYYSLVHTSNEVFECVQCLWLSNAFAYKCEEYEQCTYIRCIIALIPGARTCLGHKHPLLFYPEYKGRCVGCGKDDIKGLFSYKDCNFSLDHECFSLPIRSQRQSDKHLLSLASHDDNRHSENHICDVCEEC
ncbi:hypothetical protein Goklo_024126, partial [Gossypium klotzschianum]|nr:hypothetical protein [Gossypium klotzschianum]